MKTLEFLCDFPSDSREILEAIWKASHILRIGLRICEATGRYCLYVQPGVALHASPWHKGKYYFTVNQ